MELALCVALLKRCGGILFINLFVAMWLSSMLCCMPVYGQRGIRIKDSIRVDTASTRHLQQVDILGAKTDTRNTSPTPVQTLKGTQLERLNSFSVADAIRYFSGVQLKDYGGIGGLKTINVRSLGSNHTAVFYDGLQLGNAQNGQVDLGRFSLDNIQEIELYNGQKSEIFQPARAFTAANALYLQSAQPVFKNGEHTHIRINYKTGSFGLINPSLLWQQKLSNSVSGTISTEWVNANGRYKFKYTNGVYDTTAVRNNTDIDALRTEAGLNGRMADGSTWSVKAYGYASNRGLPGAIVANKFNYSQRQWDKNTFVQASYKTNEDKRYSLMLNAKYADDYLRYLDPEFVTTTGFQDNRFYQHELYFSAAIRYRITRLWDVALSTDYQWNNLDANLYRFPYPTRYTVLSALASQIKLPRFTVQASLLGTFVNDKVKEFTSADSKSKLSPTLLTSWQPFNTSDFLLRAFYKDIFRLPTFNDLYYTFIGNTLLRPEYTKQYNAGFTYAHHFSHGALTSIAIQTDVYYNQVKDKIVAVPSLNLYRWTMYNIGKVAVKGLEANVQTSWQAGRNLTLNIALNYTYQQARDVTDDAISYPYNIPYVPLNSGSLTAGADYGRFEFNYSYLYTGARYNQLSTNQNKVYNYMPPWYTHDMSVGYHTRIYQRPTRFTLEINNLLNQDREIIASFPMPRRFYRLKISYTI